MAKNELSSFRCWGYFQFSVIAVPWLPPKVGFGLLYSKPKDAESRVELENSLEKVCVMTCASYYCEFCLAWREICNHYCAIMYWFMRKHCINVRSVATSWVPIYLSIRLGTNYFRTETFLSFAFSMCSEQVRSGRYSVKIESIPSRALQRE